MDPLKDIKPKLDLYNTKGSTRLNSEKTYYKIFEELQDMICISAPDGKILDANPACIQMLGYDSKKDLLSISYLPINSFSSKITA